MATGTFGELLVFDWPQVFSEHRRWLSTVIRARVRDQHAVEEVLQETALAAAKSQHLADDATGISRWLYRVAIRQALLYRRKQARHVRRVEGLAGQLGTQEAGQVHHDPQMLLLVCERHDLVRQAMSRLNAKDCQLLMLKYSEGWSCAEMAQRLDVTEGAIKSRLLRARRNLRQELLNLDENWELA